MSDYRDDRRKDKLLDREQDREDRRLATEQNRQEQAEREERGRRARREAQKEADRKQAERKAARAALRGKLSGQGDTIAALVVMACAIVPAMYFQIRALGAVDDLPVGIAIALAVMLEAGAWVATVAGERAKRDGRPAGVFRAAMWAAAGVAAVVNFSHAPGGAGEQWLAYVLALASLGGVAIWELRGMGRHGGTAGRTRQQRRDDRARVRHEKARRRRFKTVWARYEDILAAHPHGTVDTETAWSEAWADVHGAGVAETAQVVAARLAAGTAIGEVLESAGVTPESAAVERLIAEIFGTGRGDDPAGGSAGARGSGPRGGGSGPRTVPQTSAQDRTALGGKGQRPLRRTAPKAVKELAPEDVDRVRDLAVALGSVDRLSARNIREALGCRTEYAVRLRDAVQAGRPGQ